MRRSARAARRGRIRRGPRVSAARAGSASWRGAHREDRRRGRADAARLARRADRRPARRAERASRSSRSSSRCSSAAATACAAPTRDARSSASSTSSASASSTRSTRCRLAERERTSTSPSLSSQHADLQGHADGRPDRADVPGSGGSAASSRRWRWCTSASAPTRSRPGRWRIPTATSRTTARSTRCAATSTGCARARRCCQSDVLGDDLKKILPVIREGGSDTATFDNVLEFLVMTGRSLPHAVLMMIPEPWQNHESDGPGAPAFYEYHASLMEPWDGPASIAFTDGTVIGAVLDRNGLRPSRYYVTKDDLVIMASEVGVLDIPPENIVRQGAAAPGPDVPGRHRRRAASSTTRRSSDELRRAQPVRRVARAAPARHRGPAAGAVLPRAGPRDRAPAPAGVRLHARGPADPARADGRQGEEPIGSMGTDTALAVLSDRPRLLYDYFKQLFAQVTNPPLDAIREELVTSMGSTIGPEGTCSSEPESCRQIDDQRPDHRQRGAREAARRPRAGVPADDAADALHPPKAAPGLERAVDELCRHASAGDRRGATILILSDRGVDRAAPIPSLLATAAVHHHLVREGTRTRCALIVESGDAREVHHCALARLRRRRGQSVPRVRDARRHDPAAAARRRRHTRRPSRTTSRRSTRASSR